MTAHHFPVWTMVHASISRRVTAAGVPLITMDRTVRTKWSSKWIIAQKTRVTMGEPVSMWPEPTSAHVQMASQDRPVVTVTMHMFEIKGPMSSKHHICFEVILSIEKKSTMFFSLSTDTSLCRNSPCGSNGQCYENNNNYNCECNTGFTGQNCTESEYTYPFA